MWSWMNILTLVDKNNNNNIHMIFLLNNLAEVLKFSFPNWQIEWPEQGTELFSWGIVAHFSVAHHLHQPPRVTVAAGATSLLELPWTGGTTYLFRWSVFYTVNVYYLIGSWELEYYNTIDLIRVWFASSSLWSQHPMCPPSDSLSSGTNSSRLHTSSPGITYFVYLIVPFKM